MSGRTDFLRIVVAASIFSVTTSAVGLEYPMQAVAAPDGTIYVADQYLPGIAIIRDGEEEVFFKASTKYRTPLNRVRCVALNAEGKLLVGDAAMSDIYRFDGAKPVPLTGRGVPIPVDIEVGPGGEIYVSDMGLHRVLKVPAAGGKPEVFAEVQAPRGLAFDSERNLWVVTLRENPLLKITPDGGVTPVLKRRAFQFPNDLAIDDQDTLYVSDGYAATIWKVTTRGKVEALVSGAPLAGPVGIKWQGGRFLVADPKAKAIFSVTRDGKVSRLFGP